MKPHPLITALRLLAFAILGTLSLALAAPAKVLAHAAELCWKP